MEPSPALFRQYDRKLRSPLTKVAQYCDEVRAAREQIQAGEVVPKVPLDQLVTIVVAGVMGAVQMGLGVIVDLPPEATDAESQGLVRVIARNAALDLQRSVDEDWLTRLKDGPLAGKATDVGIALKQWASDALAILTDDAEFTLAEVSAWAAQNVRLRNEVGTVAKVAGLDLTPLPGATPYVAMLWPLELERRRQGASSPNPSTAVTAPKRSMSQPQVDEEIRRYVAARAEQYDAIKRSVAAGRKGARTEAKAVFGRNALHRAVGCLSAAMISNSRAYTSIVADLGLDHGRAARRAGTGLEIALKAAASRDGEPVVDDVVRRETVELLHKSLSPQAAEATIEKLERGELTDEAAQEIARTLAADRKRTPPTKP